MEKKRSVGISIFAILMILDAAIFILIRSSVGFIAIGLPIIVCAIGILMLKDWARKATIWVYAIYMFFSIIGVSLIFTILPEPKLPPNVNLEAIKYLLAILTVIFGLGRFLISLFFLTRPRVKEQFK